MLTGRDNGGIFRRISFSTAVENNLLDVSPPNKIGQFLLPYVIFGDDTFPVKKNLIKNYLLCGLSKEVRIANCRISRACRLSGNVFEILANRFRVYLSPLQISVENDCLCFLRY